MGRIYRDLKRRQAKWRNFVAPPAGPPPQPGGERFAIGHPATWRFLQLWSIVRASTRISSFDRDETPPGGRAAHQRNISWFSPEGENASGDLLFLWRAAHPSREMRSTILFVTLVGFRPEEPTGPFKGRVSDHHTCGMKFTALEGNFLRDDENRGYGIFQRGAEWARVRVLAESRAGVAASVPVITGDCKRLRVLATRKFIIPTTSLLYNRQFVPGFCIIYCHYQAGVSIQI